MTDVMTTDRQVPTTSANSAPSVKDLAGRLAELFDRAEDGQNQAFWLLVTAEELHNELKKIADNPMPCGIKDLEVALDSVAWLHNAAGNVEAEFETLLDSIRGIQVETQAK